MASNLLNQQFDDSEDEEDFNPQPADESDAEDAAPDHDEDAGDQIRSEAARRPSRDESPVENAIADKDDEDEDAEGEGEDTAPRDDDDDDEDDEDEDEEEITVSNY
jgi:transcription elongation factor SPT5